MDRGAVYRAGDSQASAGWEDPVFCFRRRVWNRQPARDGAGDESRAAQLVGDVEP